MQLAEWFELSAAEDWQLLIIAVVGLVVFAAVYRVLTVVGQRRLGETIWAVILDRIYLPVVVTAVSIVVVTGSTLLDHPDLEFVIQAAVLTIVVVLWSYALVSIGNRTLRARGSERIKFAPVIANLFTIFVILIAFLVMLDIWGFDITPLLASAGLFGLVVGYAARDTISNLAAGISIYFDRTYVVGDFISLPTGERGTVVDISVRSTTILTRDNVTVTVPNAEFNKQRVTNETAPVRPRMLRLDVGVAYGSDLEAVETAMLGAAAEVDLVSDHQTPKVRFRSFDDSAITVQLQCYIEHPSVRGAATDQLIRAIDANFDEYGVKIPFPQRELTFFESGNELRVVDESTRST